MTAARWTASLLGCLVFSLALASEARAQSRSGLWLEGARATGTVRNTCAGCAGSTAGYGSAFYVRVGGELNPRVFYGLEYFSLYSNDLFLQGGGAPVDAKNVSIAPIVIWYVGDAGFFLKGGAGLSRGVFTVESSTGERARTDRIGSGLTFSVGFDLGLVSWLALSADFGTYVTAVGDVDVSGNLVDDVIATVYQVGLGLTLR